MSAVGGRLTRMGVIAATTRPGRKSVGVAQWVASRARERDGIEVDLVDLGELGLPMFDEPEHPRHQRYQHEHTKAWSVRVAGWDAVVITTPEYNHSYPGSLKNALDFLYREWRGMPVGFVSYGGRSAGIRAVHDLHPVVLELGMRPLHADVAVAFHRDHLDEHGDFHASERQEHELARLLDELQETTHTRQERIEA